MRGKKPLGSARPGGRAYRHGEPYRLGYLGTASGKPVGPRRKCPGAHLRLDSADGLTRLSTYVPLHARLMQHPTRANPTSLAIQLPNWLFTTVSFHLLQASSC